MATMELRTKENGKRYFRIRAYFNGKRYFKSWEWPEGWTEKRARKAVEDVARDFERECQQGKVQNRAEKKEETARILAEQAKIKTVSQYALQVYMPAKEQTISENGRASYQMFLDKHILPSLGEKLITEVKSSEISAFILSFQSKGYAQATCVKLYNILNGIFEMAFMDETIEQNPMARVKRPVSKKSETTDTVDEDEDEKKAYTASEMQYIFQCIKDEPLKWRTFINLMADSGARRGEVCGIMWKDIDFENGYITIRRNVQYTSSKGVYITTPKNGKVRHVDIGEDTLKLLREWRLEQASSCISPYVFNSDSKKYSSGPMFPTSPTRYFKRLGERFNIKDFHPHKLRHTSASLSIIYGGDVVSTSERLGHSDSAVTLRMYAHANEESKRKAGQAARDAIKNLV